MANTTKSLPFMDPSIRWYVKFSLGQTMVITGNTPITGSIHYSCDDIICFPRYYGNYLSWYDIPSSSIGSRMFDRQEAWDHTTRINPNTSYPYNGKAALIPGYGAYFLAVHLTDGTNIVQVNIIHRYLDNTILIYNTGKYGGNSYNISVTVRDPSGGYSVQTNGTRGTGITTLAPGQYVLFYKGTAPAVDTASGLFAVSPLGATKSQPYELWTNSFTHTGAKINIPKMYLGIKAPADIEVISNGRYLGVYSTDISSGASGNYGYPLLGWGGQDICNGITADGTPAPFNMSRITDSPDPSPRIKKESGWCAWWTEGNMLFSEWFGWGEDEDGNAKFVLFSLLNITVGGDYDEAYRAYVAHIYDVERNEAYTTTIIKPTKDKLTAGGINYNEPRPFFLHIADTGSTGASAFAYIDANDAWNKTTTTASTTWTFHDSAYGFCNYYSDKIICAEGLGIYTTDTGYTPPAPKSAFGAARVANKIGAWAIRVPSLGNLMLHTGKIYAAVMRFKNFPATTSDVDLQNWFKSLPPKSLTSGDFDNLLGILPGSFWLLGDSSDVVNISYPSTVSAGSQFTVNVSCPARPNKPVWVALVDENGNIVASNSGTADGGGNASISLTMPNTPGTYRVLAIVKGDRRLV